MTTYTAAQLFSLFIIDDDNYSCTHADELRDSLALFDNDMTAFIDSLIHDMRDDEPLFADRDDNLFDLLDAADYDTYLAFRDLLATYFNAILA